MPIIKMKKEEYVDEIEHLIYDVPKTDFEHIWNCTLSAVLDIFGDEDE